jgi:hypothetical protein
MAEQARISMSVQLPEAQRRGKRGVLLVGKAHSQEGNVRISGRLLSLKWSDVLVQLWLVV